MKKAVIIGNGRMAVDCLGLLQPQASVALVVTEPVMSGKNIVTDYCGRFGIPVVETHKINQPELVDRIRQATPDLLFSINNFKIIKAPLLAIPSGGTINFHNGPLPRYGGVNPCAWAIVNGEVEHGVTWHHVDAGIDTGDIIGQSLFPIGPRETAGTLTVRCILEGVRLFGQIVEGLVCGTAPRTKQDQARATYYSLKDIPNEGRLDFTWTRERFDRFVRALSFYPLRNTLAYPRGNVRERTFFVERIVSVGTGAGTAEPGTIVGLQSDRVDVQIADAVIGLTAVLDEERRTLKVPDFVEGYGLSIGATIDTSSPVPV